MPSSRHIHNARTARDPLVPNTFNMMILPVANRGYWPTRPFSYSSRLSHFLLLPMAAFEQHGTPQRQHRERDGHGNEYPGRAEAEWPRQHPGERHLAQPEAEEIEPGRCPGVTRTIER